MLEDEKIAHAAVTQVAKVEANAADAVDKVEAVRVLELVPQAVVRAAVEAQDKAVLLLQVQLDRRKLLDSEPDLVRKVRQTVTRRRRGRARLYRELALAATGEDQVNEAVRALHTRPGASRDKERESLWTGAAYAKRARGAAPAAAATVAGAGAGAEGRVCIVE